ncbi:MAG TPA: monofunctional biosynthetic peptidoglycan transglycosylase [Blastocatellia bacterium]|nr:monofunctional biosynthetic peptidoglycan transglycosylase [Blastocatellia bacterium]
MPTMVQTAQARTKTLARRGKRSQWRRWVKIAFLAIVGLAILYQGWIVFRVVRFKSSNPATTAMMDQRAAEVRARGEEPRRFQTWVPYDRISRNLTKAVLAGEDSRFFDHGGFDWEEMQKALEKDWNEGRFSRGASTISQQLAKNLFLSTSKNPFRKLHEAVITKEMEWILGKRRILEIYLNVIEWGDGVYGAEAAARTYFNTSAAALSADQAAFLSAIIPSPNGAFNPSKHRGRVERRKNLIERLMRHVVVPRDLD